MHKIMTKRPLLGPDGLEVENMDSVAFNDLDDYRLYYKELTQGTLVQLFDSSERVIMNGGKWLDADGAINEAQYDLIHTYRSMNQSTVHIVLRNDTNNKYAYIAKILARGFFYWHDHLVEIMCDRLSCATIDVSALPLGRMNNPDEALLHVPLRYGMVVKALDKEYLIVDTRGLSDNISSVGVLLFGMWNGVRNRDVSSITAWRWPNEEAFREY